MAAIRRLERFVVKVVRDISRPGILVYDEKHSFVCATWYSSSARNAIAVMNDRIPNAKVIYVWAHIGFDGDLVIEFDRPLPLQSQLW